MVLRPKLGKGANEKKEEEEEREKQGVVDEGRLELPVYLPVLLWLLLPMSSLGATPSSAQQQPDSTAMLTFQDPRCLNDYLPLLHQALLEK